MLFLIELKSVVLNLHFLIIFVLLDLDNDESELPVSALNRSSN
jgi:hypothetical protein